MSRLTSLAQYLRKVSGKSPVNYSAIYVVAIWLVESLTEFHSPIFNDVHTCVAVFGETMTLTSGRGISEIWAAFSSTSNGVPNPTIVSRLEAIACGSQGMRPIFQCPLVFMILPANVRRLSMEKMAVHTLPFSIEKNEFPLMSAMSEMVCMNSNISILY